MSKPVTSTIVATKGAELVAGSKPSLLRIKGSILPTKEPKRTTTISAAATAKATLKAESVTGSNPSDREHRENDLLLFPFPYQGIL